MITRKNLSHYKKPKIQNIAKKKNETNRDLLNYKVCVIFKKAFMKIFLNIFYSGGSQERLNEFLESREKMKQILDTQLQQKRKEMLQKFESERLKLLTGKLKKKQDEGKTSQRINILINLFLFEWTIIFCRSKAHDKKPSRQEEQYVQRSDYKKYR